MARTGSQKYRIESKLVHMNLLLSVDEVSILLDTSPGKLMQFHREKTLPFPSVEVGKCLIFYIPTSYLKTVRAIKELGVTKPLKFLKDFKRDRLMHLLDENTTWSRYDLKEWI